MHTVSTRRVWEKYAIRTRRDAAPDVPVASYVR